MSRFLCFVLHLCTRRGGAPCVCTERPCSRRVMVFSSVVYVCACICTVDVRRTWATVRAGDAAVCVRACPCVCGGECVRTRRTFRPISTSVGDRARSGDTFDSSLFSPNTSDTLSKCHRVSFRSVCLRLVGMDVARRDGRYSRHSDESLGDGRIH